MEDAIRDKVGGPAQHARGLPHRARRSTSTTSRSSTTRRRARSSCWRPSAADPDAEVIKTVLALTRGPRRREATYHIVAEIQNPANLEAARLVGRRRGGHHRQARDDRAAHRPDVAPVGGVGRSTPSCSTSPATRSTSTATRRLDGGTYARRAAGLRGLLRASAWPRPTASVRLNPAPRDPGSTGTRSIAIAEDDSRLENAGRSPARVDEAAIVAAPPRRGAALARRSILGWNDRAALIVTELDQYVGAGLGAARGRGVRRHRARRRRPTCAREVRKRARRPTARRSSRSTSRASTRSSCSATPTTSTPSAPTPARWSPCCTCARCSPTCPHDDRPGIVSEMLDDRNRELAQVTEVDDVIVSDRILSLVIAQISENARLEAVFGELLDADGAEMYLRPGRGVRPGRARRRASPRSSRPRPARGETAIGYRTAALAHDPSEQYGVVRQPDQGRRGRPGAGRPCRRARRGLKGASRLRRGPAGG